MPITGRRQDRARRFVEVSEAPSKPAYAVSALLPSAIAELRPSRRIAGQEQSAN